MPAAEDDLGPEERALAPSTSPVGGRSVRTIEQGRFCHLVNPNDKQSRTGKKIPPARRGDAKDLMLNLLDFLVNLIDGSAPPPLSRRCERADQPPSDYPRR
jgi:hypothetical protein